MRLPFGVCRVPDRLLSPENGKATVPFDSSLQPNALTTEKARLRGIATADAVVSRGRIRVRALPLAVASVGSARRPLAHAAVAVKIVAVVFAIDRRVVPFAMCKGPRCWCDRLLRTASTIFHERAPSESSFAYLLPPESDLLEHLLGPRLRVRPRGPSPMSRAWSSFWLIEWIIVLTPDLLGNYGPFLPADGRSS